MFCLFRHLTITRFQRLAGICHVAMVLMIMVILTGYGRAHAQGTETKTGVTAENPNLLTNVRVSIINGIVQRVNNTLKLRFRLEWALLPESPRLEGLNLKEKGFRGVDRSYLKPFPLKFTDKQLKAGPQEWIKALEKVEVPIGLDRDRLRRQGALIGPVAPGEAAMFLDEWHQDYLKYWGGADEAKEPKPNDFPQGISQQDLANDNNSITTTDLAAQRREHAFLNLLLRSGGAEATITAKEVASDLVNIKVVPGSQGEWQVQQYPFRYHKGKADDLTDDKYFFRTVITGRLPEYEITVFNPEIKSVKLTTRLEWVPREGQDPILYRLGVADPVIDFGEVTIEPEPVVKDKLKELESAGGPSRFESYLTLFGGVAAPDVITKNFLGSTRDTSVVSGGMYADKRVSSFLGLMQEWGSPQSWIRPGFVFGLDPKDSNRLFLGLGARSGIFNLAIGVASVEDDRANRTPPGMGKVQKGVLSGVFSLDLSRLLGGKTNVTKLTVDNSATGSTMGVSSDILLVGTGGYALFLVNNTRISSPLELASLMYLELPKSDTASGRIVPLNAALRYQTVFLPDGVYNVKFSKVKVRWKEFGNINPMPQITIRNGIWTLGGEATDPIVLELEP